MYVYIYMTRAYYSGTSHTVTHGRPTGQNDLNGEVTVLQGANLHCGIQFGTEQG